MLQDCHGFFIIASMMKIFPSQFPLILMKFIFLGCLTTCALFFNNVRVLVSFLPLISKFQDSRWRREPGNPTAASSKRFNVSLYFQCTGWQRICWFRSPNNLRMMIIFPDRFCLDSRMVLIACIIWRSCYTFYMSLNFAAILISYKIQVFRSRGRFERTRLQ